MLYFSQSHASSSAPAQSVARSTNRRAWPHASGHTVLPPPPTAAVTNSRQRQLQTQVKVDCCALLCLVDRLASQFALLVEACSMHTGTYFSCGCRQHGMSQSSSQSQAGRICFWGQHCFTQCWIPCNGRVMAGCRNLTCNISVTIAAGATQQPALATFSATRKTSYYLEEHVVSPPIDMSPA